MHASRHEFGGCRCVGVETSGRAAGAGRRSWKPFALPGAPTRWSRDRKFDVRHLRLEISLDPDTKRIEGTATHTVRPFLEGLTEAEFDCAELEVSRVEVGGKRCKFDHEGGKLRVTLPSAARRGRDLKITIRYSGSPRRGLYFTGPDEHHPDKPVHVWTQGQDEDSRFWFPCFDYPNEKQTSEIVCTVPAGLRVLSNGEMLRHTRQKSAGTETFHWRLSEPHVAYLVMLAVGDFEVYETSWRGVPVTYWAPRGRLADVKRTLARTPRMLTLFSRKTGVKYPYAQYAQVFVQDFIFGGMENTSATTLTDTAILDRTCEREVWMDGLIAHELGHQWFGDLVTCRDWSHGWLNEGFATFMEQVWKRHSQGEDEVAYYRMQDQAAYLAEDGGSYRRAIVCKTYFDPIEIFDRHLYQKGGQVLNMLMRELGEDLFWECVGTYLKRHAGGSVLTDDLRRAVEDVSGRNLEWFFDQWVFHGGHPQLEVRVKPAKGAVHLRIAQKQKTDELTPRFRFRVTVRIETSKGSVERELEIDGEDHTFVIDVPGKLLWVAFDPGANLLFSGKVDQSEEAWVRALADDGDGATRVRAARAIVKPGTPNAVKALAAALNTDDLWFVRVEAAKALAKIRGAAARKALVRHVGQEDPRVRRAVATALGQFRHDPVAHKTLARMLGDRETSPGVLMSAAIALGASRAPAARELLPTLFDRPSWNDSAWRGALMGLGASMDDSAVDLLLDATGPARPNSVRVAAAMALAKLGREDHRIRECLEGLVSDPWLRLQMVAANGLVRRLESESVGTLRSQAARDLDGRVVRTCKEAAVAITKGRDRGDAVAKLSDELEKVRDANRELRERLDKLEA